MSKATGQLSIVLLTFMCLSTEAAPLSVREVDQLARECAPSVAPSTLAAIAKVESDFDPLAAYDNTTGESLHWNDQAQASQSVKKRLEARHSVDVGLVQINSKNFSMLGLTPDKAVQPCTSLSAAAHLLEERYAGGKTTAAEQLALRRAISAYNTGHPTRGFTNGYVRKVELTARQMVPSLVEVKKAAETPIPEETWNVWGSYERHDRSASKTSDAPTTRKKGRHRKSLRAP